METLRRIRTMRGMNQVDLAKASGVAQNTISEIELGKREARPATLRKLARALDVEIADFFDEADRPKVSAPSSQQLTLNGELAEERRSPIVVEAVSDVAEKWHEAASHPDASLREISTAVDAALALGEALIERFGPPSAAGYSAEEWEVVRLAARLLDISKAGNERILGRGEEERYRARKEQIREMTRKLSAA